MKKNLIYLTFSLFFGGLQAQEIQDAVRFSQDNITGTARFRAMSGAFGALGGDLSSINSNPAGSAIFVNNQIGLSLSNQRNSNATDYYGDKNNRSKNSFDMNQAGAVFVFKNQYRTSNWKKFSLAINYENTNTYDNSVFSSGTNPNRSIDSYFLNYANGVPLSVLEDGPYSNLGHGAQQAYLGYQAYIINPVNANSTTTAYNSNIPSGANYFHENAVNNSGYSGKLSFNAATSYKDKLHIGINLNSHFLDFRQSSSFYEDNNASLTNDYTISRLRFNNDLYTYGTGFSFQLGAIAKVTNEFRVGLAFESPTWLRLNDEFSQNISSLREKSVANGASVDGINENINPNVINYYEPYKLQTPSKWTGSAAYVFGKKGLISIDYSIKDYSSATFKPENDSYYMDLNKSIGTTLTNSSDLRVGGEYKIEAWSLRAGYRLEKSPYKNKVIMGDLTGYSAGLGYNFGGTKLDLAYATSQRDTKPGFFDKGFTDGALIRTKNNLFTLTILFEL